MPVMTNSPDGEPERDLSLTSQDVDALRNVLASIYNTEQRATTFLRQVRYPRAMIPRWRHGSTPADFWSLIFADLDRGVLDAPYQRLLAGAYRVYASNVTLGDLHRRYHGTRPAPAGPQPPGGSQEAPAHDEALPEEAEPSAPPTCHVIAWLDSAEGQADLGTWLSDLRLDPHPEWTTPTSVSYRVNEADPHAVDRLMRARSDLAWTVVAPGTPDYVLRFLSVEGPDGRSFRFNDVPSATPVASVADELVRQYTEGLPGADQPTVVERVQPDGSHRMHPDSTLADEGIADGDRLRIGFERRAAAVNPLDRRDALIRVRNQLMEYDAAHPDFSWTPNSPTLPTEYDIEFIQPSFGPPEVPGEQPPDISVHQLSVVLPAEFPIVAPRVRWLTDIFHPNVYPTYESETLRERPYGRGLVCLGTLAESYQPSLDFGELCETLANIAGYRNYSVVAVVGDVMDEATGRPLLRGDFYDRQAAEWAISPHGQARILKIGGAPVLWALSSRPTRYGFEIDVTETVT